MFVFFVNTPLQNTMAEQDVPNQPPTRTDEQIVPRSQWLTIGKSNLLFNAQKIQKNPIFQISVDILSNTNFFQAFTASANVPAIYLQQFWNTMKYNEKTGVYSCQVDEQWFDLSADLLRKALAITPVIPAQPFELPPSGNTVIDFVNELGYPEPVEIVSNIRVNYVYQPWRAILTRKSPVLDRIKTSSGRETRHPDLQMLWGIVTQTNVDHAELIWEEFTHGTQTFFLHKASTKAVEENPKKKEISSLSLKVSQLKSCGMANSRSLDKLKPLTILVFPQYSGNMVAENTKKTPQESASVQSATKRATPKKPTTTTPVKQSKPAPPPTKKPSKRKLPQKVRKGKPTFQLVDEDDEAQQESAPQEEGDDPDLELAKQMSLEAHQEKKEGEGDDADMERAIKLSLDPAFLPQGRAPVGRQVRSWDPNPEKAHEGSGLDQDPEPMKEGPDWIRLWENTYRVSIQQSPHAFLAITPFIALQQEWHDLEQAVMMKLRRTKLADALLKVLNGHTAYLIEKYSVLPWQESIQNQESERVPKELSVIKKELALIAEENSWTKEVAARLRSQEKHDSYDDEDVIDDDGPSAGSKQDLSRIRSHFRTSSDDIQCMDRMKGNILVPTQYSRKAQPICPKTDMGLVFNSSQHVDKKPGIIMLRNWLNNFEYEAILRGAFSEKCQNQSRRTVPKYRPCILLNWSYKVGKVRSKSENKGKVPTEMELVLEYTQQGSSHDSPLLILKEVLVTPAFLLSQESYALSLADIPETSEVKRWFLTMKMENPARATSNKLLVGYLKDGDGEEIRSSLRFQMNNQMLRHDLYLLRSYERPHKGVKASANSDVMYFFTSAQDGNQLQNDERLCLGDDLKGGPPLGEIV
ncbi:hypothetical protein Tco_0291752 [Tanacetum coccineum]